LCYKNLLRVSFIFVFIFNLLFLYSEEAKSDSFYGIITSITSSTDLLPEVYLENENVKRLNINDKIFSGSTLITHDAQSTELVIYKNNKVIGSIFIDENTDVEINESGEDVFVKSNYGRVRIISQKNNKLKVFSKTIQTDISGTDFGFQSLLDTNNSLGGYFIVYDGSIKLSSIKNQDDFRVVNKGELCKFKDYTLLDIEKFSKEDLVSWKKSMIFKTKDIPSELFLALEKYEFDKKPLIKVPATSNAVTLPPAVVKPEEGKKAIVVYDVINNTKGEKPEIAVDTTDDKKEEIGIADATGDKKKEPFNKDSLISMLSFEIGGLGTNLTPFNNFDFNNFGIKFLWDPSVKALKNKFEFGTYFNLNFFPTALANKGIWPFLGTVNSNTRFANSEWSFGADQNGDTGRIIFDIFDDFLLKLKMIRYNYDTDPFFIQVGDYHNVSDMYRNVLYDYNPEFFSPVQRKISFVAKVDINWFKTFIYAEDLMPKGIYGGSFVFSTPSKSFNVKLLLSAFVDCYDIVKFTSADWYMPSKFDTGIVFETFNIPSFGLSFTFNGGVAIPFTSLPVSNYSEIITSGLIFSFATKVRFKDFNISLEFVKDSSINRMGEFDVGYNFNHANKIKSISDWYSGLSSRASYENYFTDHFFGGRLRFNYTFKKNVEVDFAYQIGASFYLSPLSTAIGTISSPNYNSLYDKLNFKLSLDSLDLWKVRCKFFIVWNVDNIVNSIIEMVNIQNLKIFDYNIFFLGFSISPAKEIEFKIQGGIHPYEKQIAFSFEGGLVIRPVTFKKDNSKTVKPVKEISKDTTGDSK
jgi:hypothetical protein